MISKSLRQIANDIRDALKPGAIEYGPDDINAFELAARRIDAQAEMLEVGCTSATE